MAFFIKIKIGMSYNNSIYFYYIWFIIKNDMVDKITNRNNSKELIFNDDYRLIKSIYNKVLKGVDELHFDEIYLLNKLLIKVFKGDKYSCLIYDIFDEIITYNNIQFKEMILNILFEKSRINNNSMERMLYNRLYFSSSHLMSENNLLTLIKGIRLIKDKLWREYEISQLI